MLDLNSTQLLQPVTCVNKPPGPPPACSRVLHVWSWSVVTMPAQQCVAASLACLECSPLLQHVLQLVVGLLCLRVVQLDGAAGARGGLADLATCPVKDAGLMAGEVERQGHAAAAAATAAAGVALAQAHELRHKGQGQMNAAVQICQLV